jgi:hypothetical protein
MFTCQRCKDTFTQPKPCTATDGALYCAISQDTAQRAVDRLTTRPPLVTNPRGPAPTITTPATRRNPAR